MLSFLCSGIMSQHLLAEIKNRQRARNSGRGTDGDDSKVPVQDVSDRLLAFAIMGIYHPKIIVPNPNPPAILR